MDQQRFTHDALVKVAEALACPGCGYPVVEEVYECKLCGKECCTLCSTDKDPRRIVCLECKKVCIDPEHTLTGYP
jgi:hypothetical protein